MVEESSRDRDPGALDSIDRVLRRIDSHPSLPAVGISRMLALGPPTAVADGGHEVREPAADVVVTPAIIYVTLELSGASRDTIEVMVDNAQLMVRARGAEGRVFHADIEIPHPLEPDAVTATYRNGVLDVTLPRRRGHRVRIKRGD